MIQTLAYCFDGKSHNAIEDTDAGERVCRKCAMVLEEKTTYEETNTLTMTTKFGTNDSYIGQTNKHLGQSTFIPKRMVDHSGKSINRNLFRQINKWDVRIKRKNVNGAMLTQLNQVCDILELNEVTRVEVESYMNKAFDKQITRGRLTRELLAAVIYYVCKMHDIPKTMSDISVKMNIPVKIIHHNLCVINNTFGAVTKTQSIDSYISKYFTRTTLQPKHEQEVLRLLKQLQAVHFHDGKNPATIIGGIMKYIVLRSNDYNGSFANIANACEISEVSLRTMCNRITPILGV